MAYRCFYPEIELRALDVYTKSDGGQHTTLLDLLEVYPDKVVWAPKLDHTRLVQHFRRVRRFLNLGTDSGWSHNSRQKAYLGQIMSRRCVYCKCFFNHLHRRHLTTITVSLKISITSTPTTILIPKSTPRCTGCTDDLGYLLYSSKE